MYIRVPSGRSYNQYDLDVMHGIYQNEMIKWFDEPRILHAGGRSHVYVLGREDVTENPDLLRAAARVILRDTRRIMQSAGDHRRPRFIGLPHVGHGWTPALSMVDLYENTTGRSACHAIMRSSRKNYGGTPGRLVEGTRDTSVFRDILFDNVVYGSETKREAATELLTDGFALDQLDCYVFVDRQQGGFAAMQAMGFRTVYAHYLLLDVCYALGQLGYWNGDQIAKVHNELNCP